MVTALAASLLLFAPQSKIDNSNFDGYFKQLERKNAYLESPPSTPTGSPTFLGKISTSTYNKDALGNKFSTYGNTYGADSIWNKYGTFGSQYNARSPWNPNVSRNAVEILYRQGQSTYIAGYLTANPNYYGQSGVVVVHPKYLARWLDRE